MSAHWLDAQLVTALGWILLHFVWQGALVGCAAAVVLTLLRNARPETRYLAACAALLLCLAWPALDLALALVTADGPAGAARGLDRVAGAAVSGEAAGLLDWLQGKLDWIVGVWAACAGALGLRMAAGLVWIGRAVRTEAFDAAWQAHRARGRWLVQPGNGRLVASGGAGARQPAHRHGAAVARSLAGP
jgi:bla regulator protein BlaR1